MEKGGIEKMWLVITLLLIGCAPYRVTPRKPQAGEKIWVIIEKKELKEPLMEVVLLKENLDYDFEVISGKKEGERWEFQIKTDSITSYVIWRIVDGDSIYFERGEGIVVYYGNKPMRLAHYYCGLHTERAIPYVFDVGPKERDKVIKKAIKCYKKELKYYPGEPMAYGRLRVVKYFTIKGERKKARYLYNLENELDSLANTDDIYALVSAFNVAYFFDFGKTYDYFKLLSERPYIPGALDASLNYLYQYARSLQPREGVKWLETGLSKYKEFLEEPSSKIKNTLRSYYYSLYYGYLVVGDTLKALDYLLKAKDLNPFDPEPYMVEASLRLSFLPESHHVVDSLLKVAEKLFQPLANSYNFPFYPKEERKSRLERKLLNFYRIKVQYQEAMGLTDSAISTMRSIIEIQGEDKADFGDYEKLGDLLVKVGKIGEAEEAYAKAVLMGSEWDNLKSSIEEELKKAKLSEDSIKKVTSYIEEKVKAVKIKAPSFVVEDLSGKRIKLEDYKGKVVVLNFWATWCGPCRREIPNLNNLVEKYKDRKDIVFIAITNDQEVRVTNFLANNPFNYLIAFDRSDAYEKYNVKAIPTHVIIDKNGYINTRIVGSLPRMDEVLSKKIEKLLE